MNKKKRQKAMEAYMASIMNSHLQVQTGMVLLEVGTRMNRIERKVDEIIKFFGIEEGGKIVSLEETSDEEKFILDTVQKAINEKRLVGMENKIKEGD